MKVAIVSQPLDPVAPLVDGRQSISIITYQFARLLAAHGHEVVVYALTRNPAQMVKISRANDLISHKIVCFKKSRFASIMSSTVLRQICRIVQPGIPFIGSVFYDTFYAVQVAFDMRRKRIEIVHIHNFSQYAPVIKAIYPHAKIVLHMNCEWLNQLPRATIKARLRSVDLVLCCSDYIRKRALGVFPELISKSHTLYNGVDTDQFAERLADSGGHDVYFIGRLSPEKGIHVLVEAFKEVVREIPGARLFVVGSSGALPRSYSQAISNDPVQASAEKFYEGSERPPYSQMLRKEVAKLPEGHVNFLGGLSHTELIERLRSAALVVQPSLWQEPFGMPVAEAMAMGLPVVVTQGGGLPEIVEDQKTGIIVERGRPEPLAAAMIDLLRAPERRRVMGTAARRRAVKRFSFRVLVAQLERHYQSLLERPGS